MDFLKKAKKAMKEHPELANDLKNMFIDKKDPKTQPSNDSSHFESTNGSHAAYASSANSSGDHRSSTYGTTPSESSPSTATRTLASSVARGGGDPASGKVPGCTFAGAPSKVSLADRRKIRDGFEDKKGDLEKDFSSILGEPWTIHVDTVGVYSYMNNDTQALSNPGQYILNYFEGALKWLKIFVQKYGATEAARINVLAHHHVITLKPTVDESIQYYDTDFLEGRWRLLFRDKAFGWNAKECGSNLEQVLNASSKTSDPSGSMSLMAKQDIKTQYDGKIETQLALARQYIDDPSLVFEPNFAANYATLSAFEATLDRSNRDDMAKLKQHWEQNFGAATYAYFAGFVSQLGWKKFNKDEMMQEAFKESVSSNQIKLLIKNDISRNRNDCVIKNGVLVIRTDILNWWTNVNDACNQLDSLL